LPTLIIQILYKIGKNKHKKQVNFNIFHTIHYLITQNISFFTIYLDIDSNFLYFQVVNTKLYMNSLYIAIVEPTDLQTEILEKQLSSALKEKTILQRINLKEFESSLPSIQHIYDLVLIGEKNSPQKAIHAAKSLRQNNYTMPILLLTIQSEAKLSHNQTAAGIDDFLNIVEITLPTFSWTLTSLLKKTEIQKKADEFDEIRHDFIDINQQLAAITHEINNPLGVIRLALFQLQNKLGSDKNFDKYTHMIADNVVKIETQIKQLRDVREKMRTNQTILGKILSIKQD
jgi:signal transduction histidine kinase